MLIWMNHVMAWWSFNWANVSQTYISNKIPTGETSPGGQISIEPHDGREAQARWPECWCLGQGRMAKKGQRGDGPATDGCELRQGLVVWIYIDRWDVSKTKLYRESVCDGYWNSLSLMWFALHSQHREEKFISQLEIIVKKKNTVEVKIEEQWMSEKEMKDELHWSSSLWHNEI